MDGLTERDRQEFVLVEDAMRTYPLANTPPDFASTVMTRIRGIAPAPRFRVSWLEPLISLFIPGAGILSLIVWASLPPQTVAYLQSRAVLLWQFLQRSQLDWVVLVSGLMVVVLFFVMILRLLRPRYRRSKVVLTIPARFF
jgi:hypothetical protein